MSGFLCITHLNKLLVALFTVAATATELFSWMQLVIQFTFQFWQVPRYGLEVLNELRLVKSDLRRAISPPPKKNVPLLLAPSPLVCVFIITFCRCGDPDSKMGYRNVTTDINTRMFAVDWVLGMCR